MSDLLPEERSPLLLLFVPLTWLPVPAQLRAQLINALRAAEPGAQLRVRVGLPHACGCHYRLLGEWTRPAAAHAALVFALSGLPLPMEGGQ